MTRLRAPARTAGKTHECAHDDVNAFAEVWYRRKRTLRH